jgi:hypothetical protein
VTLLLIGRMEPRGPVKVHVSGPQQLTPSGQFSKCYCAVLMRSRTEKTESKIQDTNPPDSEDCQFSCRLMKTFSIYRCGTGRRNRHQPVPTPGPGTITRSFRQSAMPGRTALCPVASAAVHNPQHHGVLLSLVGGDHYSVDHECLNRSRMNL